MTDDQKNLTQIRRLTQAVLVSGSVNIILMALLFYVLIKETPPRPYFELKPAKIEEQQPSLAADQGNGELIRSFRLQPPEQLFLKLSNTQQVENGYMQRDIALASLVSFYHFDLSKALLNQPQPSQQRKIAYGKNRKGDLMEITVFPGLSEQQFQAIISFAKTERWPFTSQGLFNLLRKKKLQHDSSLADAFFLTPEFLSVETLFNRSEVHVEKMEILKILCQGNWTVLSTFTEQQRKAQDLSPAKRQRFLLDYITLGSPEAANLLLKTDSSFAVNKLDDSHVILILNLLNEKTVEAETFALGLLTSPRSDAVWQIAANRLYEFSGEVKPEKNMHHLALMRFVPQTQAVIKTSQAPRKEPKSIAKPVELAAKPKNPSLRTIKAITKPPAPKPLPPKPIVRTHKVQDGDSLWKIAKKYKVKVDDIKKQNNLQSDFLKLGTTLKIPN